MEICSDRPVCARDSYHVEFVEHRLAITLPVSDGEQVPAILQLPAASRAVPAVLLLHGVNSRKEQMADSIGRALLARNVGAWRSIFRCMARGNRPSKDCPCKIRSPSSRNGGLPSKRRMRPSRIWLSDPPSMRVALRLAATSLGAFLATTVVEGNRSFALSHSLPAATCRRKRRSRRWCARSPIQSAPYEHSTAARC